VQTVAVLEAAAGRARRAAWLYGAGEALLESGERRIEPQTDSLHTHCQIQAAPMR
jgi:hypothetical protein